MKIGCIVLSIADHCGALKKGNIYVVESVNHPNLGNCGLIKLKGVRDYWHVDSFIEITHSMIEEVLVIIAGEPAKAPITKPASAESIV